MSCPSSQASCQHPATWPRTSLAFSLPASCTYFTRTGISSTTKNIFIVMNTPAAYGMSTRSPSWSPNGDRSQAGFYRTKIGKIEVIALSDGTVGLGLTKELIQRAKPGQVERLLARHLQTSPLDASVNAFLIKYEDKLVLIDAGSSELVGPTAGKLPQSLRAAGAPPRC